MGVALAARGATASSEAADVVLTVDRVDAILIARRSKRIALRVLPGRVHSIAMAAEDVATAVRLRIEQGAFEDLVAARGVGVLRVWRSRIGG